MSTDQTDVRAAVEQMWAEAEARAERRGVTEPTRSLAPNCPPWCVGPHRAGDLDFELDENDALRRFHCGKSHVVEKTPEPGQPAGGVEWWLGVTEYLDGSHGPVEISVETFGRGSADLTPGQARRLAAQLANAAEIAEETAGERSERMPR